MQITKLGDYAVRTMIHLASGHPDEIFRISEISRLRDIPESFLRKIIPRLKNAGLIHSTRGNKGGIILADDARNINALQVIESVEGEISLNQCVLYPQSCPQSGLCAMHDVWIDARNRIREALMKKSLADLIEKHNDTGRAAG